MQSTVPGQQQQQVIVTTGNQPQLTPQWVVAAPPRHTTVSNYMHRQSTVLGMVLVIVGVLSIVFNIVDLAVWNSDYYQITTLGFVGHGFWSGVMSVIAGGFGIGAARSRTNSCQIRAFLVLCIFAACFNLGQLITAVIGAAIVGSDYSSGGYYGNDLCCVGSCGYYDYSVYLGHYSYYTSRRSPDTTCIKVRTLIAMEALLAILSFIGGIAAIWGSALGCRAACCCNCCCCVDPYPQLFTIVENNGVPMTVITQQQQQQQQSGQAVSVQYPAQYPMQYPMNYPTSYPAGSYVQSGYQFTAASPYYPPPSTALASPQQRPLQTGVASATFPPDAASEPVYKNC